MKIPIRFVEEIIHDETVGDIVDFKMIVDAKIDFPIDGFEIVSQKGPRYTFFEVYTIQTAKNMKEKYPQLFGGMSEFVLGKIIREELISSMSKGSELGKHPFVAYIDRPKDKRPTKQESFDLMSELIPLDNEEPVDDLFNPTVFNDVKPDTKKKVATKQVPVTELISDQDNAEESQHGIETIKVGLPRVPTRKLNVSHRVPPQLPPRQNNFKA